MKKYCQFSFENETVSQKSSSNILILKELSTDLFPFYKIRSITSILIVLHVVSIIFNIVLSQQPKNAIYQQSQNTNTINIFEFMFGKAVQIIYLLMIGSQTQSRLGIKYYVFIIICCQLIKLILIGWLNVDPWHSFHHPLYAFYILSVADIKSWKQSICVLPEASSMINNKQMVESIDLLDLNNTVIKLRPHEMNYSYESYTNRQFNYHNIDNHKNKTHSNIKQNKFNIFDSAVIENDKEEISIANKIYKLVVYNFILYSANSIDNFVVLILCEGFIYILISWKIFSKLLWKLK